jgi:hypothetical protein
MAKLPGYECRQALMRIMVTNLSAAVISGLLLLCTLPASALRAEDKPWPPPSGVPMTIWGKEISPDKPVLPEYPRPQMVRQEWLNLNGPWDYAITARNAPAPASYAGKILVPFPVESVLSQVARKMDGSQRLWYARTFEIPTQWTGQDVLLNFGAVDWDATVTVNGHAVGRHTGGYDGFSFNITNALNPTGPQNMVVSVWDGVCGGFPHGKQALGTGYITYTPAIGIWQTVWLEPVPPVHIESLKMFSDIDKGLMNLTVDTGSGAVAGQAVEAVVTDNGHEVARAAGVPGQAIAIAIPHAKLWWPESPFLYDVQITLSQQGKRVDSVGSYFGMRSITLGPDGKGITRMLLNKQFIFENGLLDQGYWPDGIYTAPTDAALRFDIDVARRLGYNMLRKHVKVEPDRWYYWADKLGMLVWQDMPSAGEVAWGDYQSFHVPHDGFLADPWGNFESELRRMVRGRLNHPCIVMWIDFNEGWGLRVIDKTDAEPAHPAPEVRGIVKRMMDAVREEDPSRLINPEGGRGGGQPGEGMFDFKFGDVLDYHAYAGEIPKADQRAAVLGEYGWAHIHNSAWSLLEKADAITISGMVNTQLTDVENEENGAVKYDRSEKIGGQDGKDPTTLDQNGRNLVDEVHKVGYLNYPGRDPAAH